ncbi:hypothetical protein EN866_19375 [Mesorhizobium sp. M2D.F.Ca.ET.223.01.1.1]|uniref:hypothetical protein n=1 Tax=unclassified Mesorhizobium TaxID=325217 RepID=UPI000FCADEDE|nr:MULTISPECIES: hypothetical protein [unclassified Mesorhizobium]TGP89322.1 hypothetical protein EN864_19385 [bacterium M00.F.Ca.ET.221.01.1.1]TGP94695.1 hypothetical protein EN865_15255 [bacterium M00.F.Ca.ET.222.01.1.1]RVD58891.1 hypothetical protein EN783_14740 [Mesorhizobium sp. M2D.F.Ca.ET.140.01.1.1]TGP27920.1 hypothetical protein EN875_033225 [Mesorhizobium sp. M2D.F.Ca.ET.232.01.1.1]TGP75863.1 hypothetical protein EN867_15255 [Mesorhizobium sp. M2D.F.Ca.ET.224.01.1.1]
MPARHKSIHSDAYLDRFWPHHAVIPWENCCEKAFDKAHKRGTELGMASRRHFIRRDNREYQAFRFKEPEQAEAMAAEFGGETYFALDRGKGSGWEKWRKKIKTSRT